MFHTLSCQPPDKVHPPKEKIARPPLSRVVLLSMVMQVSVGLRWGRRCLKQVFGAENHGGYGMVTAGK